jgi:pyridoxal phosphate enzyme (YggS family)
MTAAATRDTDLATALAALRDRLSAAAAAAGRDVDDIELLPVTKFFPATDVAILWRLGCRAFGESRVQEASAKIAEFGELTGATGVRWDMIGTIQSNKAKAIAAWADTVHSLSTAKVAAALNRGAAHAIEEGVRTVPVRVFVQISLDGDTSRGGVDVGDPAAVDSLCAEVADAGALKLVGLMAIPPLGADPDRAFAALAAEHRRVLRNHPEATELSAGMSGDLEAAVRHGSTCVRVGTALMGQRPLTSP